MKIVAENIELTCNINGGGYVNQEGEQFDTVFDAIIAFKFKDEIVAAKTKKSNEFSHFYAYVSPRLADSIEYDFYDIIEKDSITVKIDRYGRIKYIHPLILDTSVVNNSKNRAKYQTLGRLRKQLEKDKKKLKAAFDKAVKELGITL